MADIDCKQFWQPKRTDRGCRVPSSGGQWHQVVAGYHLSNGRHQSTIDTPVMPPNQRQKLYCYVDETGQDVTSNFFIVVAVVSAIEQEGLRQALLDIEHEAGTGHRGWHILTSSSAETQDTARCSMARIQSRCRTFFRS
jgi:hypothetical protein